MKQLIAPGKYVVAVSGGVDSVVLLDMLAGTPGVELVVAHYDHGIRSVSGKDRQFVASLAQKYGLPFEYAEGKLGLGASEDLARVKRYEFLNAVKSTHNADALVTAHHQDDVLETMIINLLRGTGRKGLSSLQSTPVLARPLLHYSKPELIEYAEAHQLTWHEDETNRDQAYFRNWVRRNIVPKLTEAQRQELLAKQGIALENNKTIDVMLDAYISPKDPTTIARRDITELPHAVAVELIAHWLRSNQLRDIDKKLLERVAIGAKTLVPGKRIDLKGGKVIKIGTRRLQLIKE